MTKNNELSERKRKDSLNYSIKDGSAFAVMDSAGNGYITPFALALGADNSYIGFLSSIPNLISSLFQLKTPRLMEKYSRKKLVTNFALVQAFMWLPLVIISLFNSRFTYALLFVMIFYVLVTSINAFISPVWASWIKDLVPSTERGGFFGKRNLINGAIGLFSVLILGLMLDIFKGLNILFVGFALLFLFAVISRILSRYFLSQQYEPKLHLDKHYYFTFIQFVKKMASNNFGRFVIFLSLFQLGVNIASPFFTVYMLKELKFSYTYYTILVTIQALATLTAMPIWGKFADKYGNVRTMKITSMLVPILPFLWLLSPDFYYLVSVQIFAGFFWAGFNLSASNFIYDSVSRERIGICVAYSNVFNTLGVFIGAILGGFLSNYITVINPFFALFIISGVLRFIIPFIMWKKISEVRKVSHFNIKDGIKEQIDSIMKLLRIPI